MQLQASDGAFSMENRSMRTLIQSSPTAPSWPLFSSSPACWPGLCTMQGWRSNVHRSACCAAAEGGHTCRFDAKLEAALRHRRRGGRHMPYMRVIPPGLDFTQLKVTWAL